MSNVVMLYVALCLEVRWLWVMLYVALCLEVRQL